MTRLIDCDSFLLEVEDGPFKGDLQEFKLAIKTARNRLTEVVVRMSGDRTTAQFRLCVQTYFRLAANAAVHRYNETVESIAANLKELYPKFCSPELIVAPVEKSDATFDAAAYVKRKASDVVYEFVMGPDPSRRAVFEGPLRLRFDSKAPVGTRASTIIHEATHRFIGTRDWAYSVNDDMIGYEADFIANNIPLKAGKSENAIKSWYDMSTLEALNNADSYAGFVRQLDTA